jgi:hypothetical protein
VAARSQVELPSYVGGAFEVYVNGVRQQPGVDFRQVGRVLVFERELAGEGRLGFWRWCSIILGVAGTYRRNDVVDVVYQGSNGRAVASLVPESVPDEPTPS